jgi:hypothetical protein
LLGLLSNPENGNNMFIWNVSEILLTTRHCISDHTTLYSTYCHTRIFQPVRVILWYLYPPVTTPFASSTLSYLLLHSFPSFISSVTGILQRNPIPTHVCHTVSLAFNVHIGTLKGIVIMAKYTYLCIRAFKCC